MDFFGAQDRAKGLSFRLVLLFILALVLTGAAVYFAVVLILNAGISMSDDPSAQTLNLWNLETLGLTMVSVSGIILIASLVKTAQLSGGGAAVAEMMGGRRIDLNPGLGAAHDYGEESQRVDPTLEKRLLNIVEEMALASGVPMPEVYILPERGINAFAAGTKIENAVVAVTRGALEQLDRDELQGVVAHEFSHILNQDMRLNVRLIGILFGLFVLTVIGRMFIRTGYAAGRSKEGGKNPLPLIGLVLLIVGSISIFFGRWIQSAISRQREYLADASAVQFTRNPAGIAGALKKIGGYSKGSKLDNAETVEVSHMLFGSGTKMNFIFATHPPLVERIRRIEPNFNGEFPESWSPASAANEAQHAAVSGFQGGGHEPLNITPENLTQSIGAPDRAHLDHAAGLLAHLPQPALHAAHETFGAICLVFALLLDDDDQVRGDQMEYLIQSAPQGTAKDTIRLWGLLREGDPRDRLALVDLCLPALRMMTHAQFETFSKNLWALIESDGSVDLFEYALTKIVDRALAARFEIRKQKRTQHTSLQSIQGHLGMLYSGMAWIGSDFQADQARAAYDNGFGSLDIPAPGFIENFQDCDLNKMNDAMEQIDSAAPSIKKRIVHGLATIVDHDGQMTVAEAELLRAVCEAIGVPMPPVLSSQDS